MVKSQKYRIGDQVRLVENTSVWAQNPEVRGRTGVVTDLVDDGTGMARITVSYDGEAKFFGMDENQFEPAN